MRHLGDALSQDSAYGEFWQTVLFFFKKRTKVLLGGGKSIGIGHLLGSRLSRRTPWFIGSWPKRDVQKADGLDVLRDCLLPQEIREEIASARFRLAFERGFDAGLYLSMIIRP